jgi:hypothetical protein
MGCQIHSDAEHIEEQEVPMNIFSTRRVLRGLLGAGAAIGALGVLAGTSLAENPAGQGLIGDQPPSVTDTCFWKAPTRPDTNNVLALDTEVSYYYTSYHLPPGAQVVLHGEFPHSRFMSLTAYHAMSGQAGFPSFPGLNDFEIVPDPGSANPFQPGTMRTVYNRAYTVTLSGDADPGEGNRAPNTLYTGVAGQTDTTQFVEVIYRIYVPDKNYDLAGGVPTPDPVLVMADNSTVTGQALCDELDVVSGAGAPVPPFGPPIGLSLAQYNSLLALGVSSGVPSNPGTDPVIWDKFFNPQRIVVPFWRNTPLAPLIAILPTTLTSGFYATPANFYVTGYASRNFGPDPNGHNIVVLQGKLPTHPTTFQRNPFNDSAGKQVRYWSLCNYGAPVYQIGTYPVLMDGCLYDEEIPTDADGFYTIVVSLPEDRPANAVERCGVAWLDFGKGDWLNRPDLVALVIRNQLPAPDFTEGIDKVLVPGTEQQVMGDYYPQSTNMTKEQFEALGCK